jgi:predicted  nucleic acid-binding Zn-ribbon protein
VRDYACFDVLYYTALYGEASTIAGKGESMELYRNTLKGSWQYIEGKKAYVFTEGCFLGLQVLGDDVEPCFEGASFYSQESILAILEKYEKKTELFQIPEQGGNIMNINFKLSDGQKHDILFNLLNPNFNEDGGWSVDCVVCEVYEDYALVVNYAEASYERVYYSKDDAEDKIEITKRERCYIVDVNTEERDALNAIRGEGTFAQAVENIAEKDNTISSLNTQVEENANRIQALEEENQTYSTKVGELENNISTLTIERDAAQVNFQNVSEQLGTVNNELDQARSEYNELQTSYSELQTNFANMETERNELANFKKDVVDNQKRLVINGYVDTLDASIIESYTNNMDQYSAEELDMRLTYECKKANPSIFSKNPTTEPAPAYIPKDENTGHGINDILARYEKK